MGLPLPWHSLPVFIPQTFCLAQELQQRAQSNDPLVKTL